MKKFLALILTLGFVGSMAARGCCGSCGSKGTKSTEARPNCEIMVPKKVCAKRHTHVTWSCPATAACPVTKKQVQVNKV